MCIYVGGYVDIHAGVNGYVNVGVVMHFDANAAVGCECGCEGGCGC